MVLKLLLVLSCQLFSSLNLFSLQILFFQFIPRDDGLEVFSGKVSGRSRLQHHELLDLIRKDLSHLPFVGTFSFFLYVLLFLINISKKRKVGKEFTALNNLEQ